MPQTAEELKKASKAFYAFAKFPRTIGAIDCTHVKIQSPGGAHAENYRDRKGWFSINVQTVVDAEARIINIVARWPGASHDQTIFNASRLRRRLEDGDFANYLIVADSGYRNTTYMVTPFLPNAIDSPQKELFNVSQIRTRNVVERSYGIWKRRFPVLSTGIKLRKMKTVLGVIVASAILHNIAINTRELLPVTTDNEDFEQMLRDTAEPPPQAERNRQRDNGNNARMTLVNGYFRHMLQDNEQN